MDVGCLCTEGRYRIMKKTENMDDKQEGSLLASGTDDTMLKLCVTCCNFMFL